MINIDIAISMKMCIYVRVCVGVCVRAWEREGGGGRGTICTGSRFFNKNIKFENVDLPVPDEY